MTAGGTLPSDHESHTSGLAEVSSRVVIIVGVVVVMQYQEDEYKNLQHPSSSCALGSNMVRYCTLLN